MKLSIIICTHNRNVLLDKCLYSLVGQNLDEVEVIVVDNNSKDKTKNIVEQYSKTLKQIKYVFEPETGLSNARNTGYKNADSDWILYLDDDAIPFQNMVERALYLVDLGNFDCIGGMYYGYFNKEKPKWVDESYGTKNKFSEEVSLCPFYIPHGGIVVYRKSIVEKVGGFSADYGMKGYEIGYTEETELQKRIFEIGGIIMFDPHLQIYHLNKTERLNVFTMLKQGYALGRNRKIRSDKNIFALILLLLKALIIVIFKLPFALLFVIFKSGYYWQNLIMTILYPIFFNIGRLKSKILEIYNNRNQNK